MNIAPQSYELSQEADNDLQEIYDFTNERFGTDQAINYLTGIDEIFNNLCIHPHIVEQEMK